MVDHRIYYKMEYLYLFFVLLFAHSCVVLGRTTTTEETNTVHTTGGHITVTGQTDHINMSRESENSAQQTLTDTSFVENEQASDKEMQRNAQQTLIDTSFVENEQASNKTIKEMHPDELATWLSGIRSTFTNQVQELPKTSPLTQKPSTHSNMDNTVSTVTDSFLNGEANTMKTSLLSEILSSTMKASTSSDALSTGTNIVPGETDGRDLTTSTVSWSAMSSSTSTLGLTETLHEGTDSLHTTTNATIIDDVSAASAIERISTSDSTMIDTSQTADQGHASQTTTEHTVTTTGMEGNADTIKELDTTTNLPRNTTGKTLNKISKSKQFESLHRKRFMQVMRILNATGEFNMTQLESLDPDLIPPEELARFLNSVHRDNTTMLDEDLTIEPFDIVQKVISKDKLLVAVCTISVATFLFIVLICIIRCRKIKPAIEPQSESMKSDILQLSKKSKSSLSRNGSVNSDTFMGIPTNNAIWRDIQSLPETASSVMPESKAPEVSKF